MRRGVVREHQRVLAVLVLEEVEDALVLHQAGDEAEGSLVVLHAVFARRVALRQAVLVVGEAEFGEEARDDVGRGLVLEDAAVGGERQMPEPGPEFRVVGRQALA